MIVEEINELISQPLENLSYEIVDISYKKENGNMTLRIVVDKDEDISLEDIVKVSEVISTLLDDSEIIKDHYYLDVSSLGAEKPININKLDRYIDKYINIHLVNPFEGENYLEGNLKQINEDKLDLEVNNKSRKKIISLDIKNIDKARLAIKF